MAAVSGFIVISLLVSILFLLGFLNLLMNPDRGKTCDMTYMFEYPQFVRIRVPENNRFAHYGLYAYSEGVWTQQVRDMKFKGVPVLFIPGNGGSHKQVRSLSSIALRKALSSRVGYHFDFFTVDLNEELSGLYGGVLESQSQFVNHSLYRILDLYTGSQRKSIPNSVIVVGHSMGGMVALRVLVDPKDSRNVDLIITLCTPHLRPAILLDSNMEQFYTIVDRYWKPRQSHLVNKTVIAIGGGQGDRLINTMLTNSMYTTMHTVTTAIPGVWLSMGHVVIVWCKQLLMVILNAMFASVNTTNRQLISDANLRNSIFQHYFLHNSGIKVNEISQYENVAAINPIGEWIERVPRQQMYNLSRGTPSTKWYMIRLILNDQNHKHLVVRSTNLKVTNWIFHCSANVIRENTRVCEAVYHLSQISNIAPTQNLKRRLIHVDLEELHRLYPSTTHVIVRVLPSSDPVKIEYDIFNPAAREINITVPAWYSLSRTVVVRDTQIGAIHYIMRLQGLEQVHQAFLLMVEPEKCTVQTHHAVASFKVPWASHDSHNFFTESYNQSMHIRLFGAKPTDKKYGSPYIELTLDPACRYTVSIRSSVFDSLGQIARHYAPMLMANIGAALILALRYQLMDHPHCPPLHSALASATKPYYLVTIAKLAGKTLSWTPLITLLHLPRPDLTLLTDENMEFLLLPLGLYTAGAGLVYALSLSLWSAVILSGSAVQKLALGFLARTLFGSIRWSDWMLNGLHRFPSKVALGLLLLSYNTCGALALGVATVFYFLKLVKMYEDYLEALVCYSMKVVARKIGKMVRTRICKPNDPPELPKPEACKEETTPSDTEKASPKEQEDVGVISPDVDPIGETSQLVETVAQEQLSEVPPATDRSHDLSADLGGIHFHFTGFLIWCLVTLLSVPAILTWARHFRFDATLPSDPSIGYTTILCSCAIILWQIDAPKVNLKFNKEVGYILYVQAVIAIVYSSISLYRLSYILASCLLLVAMHQRFAPVQCAEESTEDDDFAAKRDLLKAKWE